MIDDIWGNPKCGLSHLSTVLRPIKNQQYNLFESNEISLIGIIDNS